MKSFWEMIDEMKPKRLDIPVSNFEIILEDCRFDYHKGQLGNFCRLWNEGWHIKTIARKLGQNHVNTILICIDQELKGNIKPREGGYFGIKK